MKLFVFARFIMIFPVRLRFFDQECVGLLLSGSRRCAPYRTARPGRFRAANNLPEDASSSLMVSVAPGSERRGQ